MVRFASRITLIVALLVLMWFARFELTAQEPIPRASKPVFTIAPDGRAILTFSTGKAQHVINMEQLVSVTFIQGQRTTVATTGGAITTDWQFDEFMDPLRKAIKE